MVRFPKRKMTPQLGKPVVYLFAPADQPKTPHLEKPVVYLFASCRPARRLAAMVLWPGSWAVRWRSTGLSDISALGTPPPLCSLLLSLGSFSTPSLHCPPLLASFRLVLFLCVIFFCLVLSLCVIFFFYFFWLCSVWSCLSVCIFFFSFLIFALI